MKLIVGLGNPGREYANTRHNIGFMVVQKLCDRWGMGGARQKFHASVVDARIGDQQVMLMQPLTYMNRSGLAVGEAMRFHRIEPADLLVVVDETALEPGQIRLRPSGSPGGHNGLLDVGRALGSDDYPRMRLGVGANRVGEHKVNLADWVLSPFPADLVEVIGAAVDKACQAAECWVKDGLQTAMNRFNSRPESQKPDAEKPAKPAPRGVKDPRGDQSRPSGGLNGGAEDGRGGAEGGPLKGGGV